MIKNCTVLLLGLLGIGFLLGGCQTKSADKGPVEVTRFLIEADSAKGAFAVKLPISGVTVRVSPKPVVTEFDIRHVSEAEVEMGRCLLFQLTPSASRDLYRLSAANIGRRLVVVINGEPLGARLIERPLESGMLFIFLEVPDESLPELVENLNHTTMLIQKEEARRE